MFVHSHAHKHTNPEDQEALQFNLRFVKVGSQRVSKPQNTLTYLVINFSQKSDRNRNFKEQTLAVFINV